MSDNHWTPETEAAINNAVQSTSYSIQYQIGLLIQMFGNIVPPRSLMATAVEASMHTLCNYEQAAANHGAGTPKPESLLFDRHRAMFFCFMTIIGMLKANAGHIEGIDLNTIREHPMVEAREWLARVISPEPVPEWVNEIVVAAQREQEQWVDSRAMGEVAGRA